jgi:hypothetical protein
MPYFTPIDGPKREEIIKEVETAQRHRGIYRGVDSINQADFSVEDGQVYRVVDGNKILEGRVYNISKIRDRVKDLIFMQQGDCVAFTINMENGESISGWVMAMLPGLTLTSW